MRGRVKAGYHERGGCDGAAVFGDGAAASDEARLYNPKK